MRPFDPDREDLTAFVGRHRELDDLAQTVRGGSRFTTVIGPPGAGKTRLVRRFARTIASTDPTTTVVYVELMAARDEADVVRTVASALGTPPPRARAASDHIGRVFDLHGPVLLVADNCDPVVEWVGPVFTRWLARAASLRVLATSRETSNVAGERVLEVGPMRAEDAVALFRERAARVPGGRSSADAEDELVAALVDRLDRLPLAIELAAAWSSVFDVRSMLERLIGSLALLRATDRDGVQDERHTTFESAIEWSFRALDESEQRALVELAVFEAPFTIAAATAVLRIGGIDPSAAEDVVLSLRRRSFLFDAGGEESRRLRLYESVRTFASGKTPEVLEEARARHADHFASYLETRSSLLRLCEPRATREVLAVLDEVRSAHAYAVRSAPSVAVRLLVHASPLLRNLGFAELEADLAKKTLASADLGDRERADMLLFLGRACLMLEDSGRASAAIDDFDRWVERSSDLLADQRIERAIARAELLGRSGRAGEGIELLRKTLTDSADAPDPLCLLAAVRLELGTLLLPVGHLEAAMNLLERAALELKPHDMRRHARALSYLAICHQYRGHFEEAVLTMRRCIAIGRDAGLPRFEAEMLYILALEKQEQGALAEAEELQTTALCALRRVGASAHEALLLADRALLLQERGLLTEARGELRSAMDACRERNYRRWDAIHRGYLGRIDLESGDIESARDHLREAIAIASEIDGADSELAFLCACDAAIRVELGDEKAAEAAWAASSRHAARFEGHQGVRDAIFVFRGFEALMLARSAWRRGDAREALHHVRLARQRLESERPRRREARLTSRSLERAIERAEHVMRSDPPPEVHIGDDAGIFTTSDGLTVDLSNRPPLRRILAHLVERCASSPGVGVYELAEVGWPGQSIDPTAAENRVRVAISTLRKLGLARVLRTGESGYYLERTKRMSASDAREAMETEGRSRPLH